MKALVLFSGGQDSTTCLAQACNDFPGQVKALGFDYGQRHRIELEQAKKVTQLAGVPFDIVSLDFMAHLAPNALTDHTAVIEQKDGELPSTFVPGRNLFFLSSAAIKAMHDNIHILYTGVCQTDFSGYPDCRQDFIDSAATTISLALDYKIAIKTPLMYLTKAETVLKMQSLNRLDWYKHSHTCYEGKRPACGKCPACILRAKGFKQAGIKDPLENDH